MESGVPRGTFVTFFPWMILGFLGAPMFPFLPEVNVWELELKQRSHVVQRRYAQITQLAS